MKFKVLLVMMLCVVVNTISCKKQNTGGDPHYKSSTVNSKFDFYDRKEYPDKSFESYIKYGKEIIKKGRADLKEVHKGKALEVNAPFISKPTSSECTENKAIVAIHGLGDSPFSYFNLRDYFTKRCYTFYAVLLTGHGTRVGDLLDISREDWRKVTKYGISQALENHDKVYLMGYSLGATLVADYVLSIKDLSPKIAGIIDFSPAFAISSLATLADIIKFFKPFYYLYKEDNMVSYVSESTDSIGELYKTIKEVHDKAKNNSNYRNMKVFSALSYEDQTVDLKDSLSFLLANTNPKKRKILIYHAKNVPDKIAKQENVELQYSPNEEMRVLDMAHVSIPFVKDNFWYGFDGEYRSCYGYSGNVAKYNECKNSKNVFYGNFSKENMKNHIVAQSYFNPYSDSLYKKIESFMQE